jgi:serine/threonine-protein kinase SRPK3
LSCQLFELLAGGDYLFDPQAGSRYSKDEDHIAQIIELIGEFPQSLAFSGKYSSRYFNRKGKVNPFLLPPFVFETWTCSPNTFLEGELRHINKLRFWPLEDVLHDKYELTREIAQTIASFLSPMLRLNPEKRAGAGELSHHRWLDGTVVQGEIDVIRRAEEEEARRREPSSPSSSTGPGLSHFGAGSDADALKPVDDDSHTTDDERPTGASGMSGGASGTSGVNAPPTLQMPRPASATAKENLKQALAKQQQQQATSTSGSQSRKRS